MRNTALLAAAIGLLSGVTAQAQWQTYSQTEPTFRMKYPVGWTAEAGQTAPDETLGDLVLKARTKVLFKVNVEQANLEASVVVYEAPERATLDAVLEGLTAQSAERKATEGKVGDLRCAWYQESSNGRSSVHTYFRLDEGVYHISLEAPTPLFAACMQGYQHMLRSLYEGPGADWNYPGTSPGEEIIGPDGAPMVWVPAGSFVMGARNSRSIDGPPHMVYVSGFWIDKMEVTNEQYARFLDHIRRTGDHRRCHREEPPSTDLFPPTKHDHTPVTWRKSGMEQWNGPKQPVVGVDWYSAYAYAAWAGERLPTEAEWEKAARGTDERQWPWGNERAEGKCNGDLCPWMKSKGVTLDVDSYSESVSPYGCLNMAGNVWEWCGDWWDDRYYGRETSPRENPVGPTTPPSGIGSHHVLRGGSWEHLELGNCSSYYRHHDGPLRANFNTGFRCVIAP